MQCAVPRWVTSLYAMHGTEEGHVQFGGGQTPPRAPPARGQAAGMLLRPSFVPYSCVVRNWYAPMPFFSRHLVCSYAPPRPSLVPIQHCPTQVLSNA
eukprot:390849-Rhodomonas_salina.3